MQQSHIDIKIYGGFSGNGTETMLSQRDAITNVTTLSGDFSGDDIVMGAGSTLSITNNTENAYHIMITLNLTTAAIIDGFTIKGGNATDIGTISYGIYSFSRGNGGGLYNRSSSPTLANLIFSYNEANFGGGLYNHSSDPTFTNVIFSSNLGVFGGAVYNLGSSPIFTNVTFSNNSATSGGAISNSSGSSPTLYNTVFYGNSSDIEGDGNIDVASSHNASDGTGGNINTGTGFVALSALPFQNSIDPDGADDTWFTTDDGLALVSGSTLLGVGTTTNAPINDIIGSARPNPPAIGAYEVSVALPVELIFFKGEATESGNLLTWQTASEENNEGFYIEKSEDGNPDSYRGWETLDFVQGNGTTLEISDYQYLDEIPLGNITYYRLKQVDFDGQFEYSEIVEITNQQSDNSTINIFPNPIRNVLNIENGEGEAIIYNLLGQPIQSFSIPNSAFLINISDLPRGQYILHIRQQNGEVITTQFIK